MLGKISQTQKQIAHVFSHLWNLGVENNIKVKRETSRDVEGEGEKEGEIRE
jgi:hypothetical protein